MRKVQKTDWREGHDARARGSGGSAFAGPDGTSSTEAMSVGATSPPTPGTCAIGAGAGLAAETWQQEPSAGAFCMLNEGACPPIIGQCDVQCPAAACNQHEPSADNGIANTTITSAQPTSLNRHVIFLLKILRASALPWL